MPHAGVLSGHIFSLGGALFEKLTKTPLFSTARGRIAFDRPKNVKNGFSVPIYPGKVPSYVKIG